MNNRKVKVGIAQLKCEKDKQANINKAVLKIRELAQSGAQIICLQELFASLYFCDVEDYDNFALAETIPGPTTDLFSSLAKELNVVIVASLFEKRAEGKMHIPDDPGYYEKFYFTPGDLGYKVFQTKYANIGVLICWDQWYPEAARITAMRGADILFYPTAIGWASCQDRDTNVEQYNAWQTIQRAHSVANGLPVVSVNRTGVEGEMQFWGGSFITNAFGALKYMAPHLDEALHVEELDLAENDSYRRHWPYFRDRRIDSYQPILKRFLDDEQ